MSNLQPNCCLKFDFQKVDQHAGGKWLIHDTKRRKDNQLQSLKLPCRISKVQGQKHPGRWGIVEHQIPSIKVLFKTNTRCSLEDLKKNQTSNFPANFGHWWLRYLFWNCRPMNVTVHYWWWVNIGSGNGLVLSRNKPLPEPRLIQIYAAIWRH